MNPDKNFRSHARWPEDTIAFSMNGTQITTDDHDTEEQAQAVCNMLERDGFGGEDKIFPVETWVTPIPFEEQFPEAGVVMEDLMQTKKGRQQLQFVMNCPPEYQGPLTPTIERETPKVGRNDPCPCGSGNKYKKCCL